MGLCVQCMEVPAYLASPCSKISSCPVRRNSQEDQLYHPSLLMACGGVPDTERVHSETAGWQYLLPSRRSPSRQLSERFCPGVCPTGPICGNPSFRLSPPRGQPQASEARNKALGLAAETVAAFVGLVNGVAVFNGSGETRASNCSATASDPDSYRGTRRVRSVVEHYASGPLFPNTCCAP